MASPRPDPQDCPEPCYRRHRARAPQKEGQNLQRRGLQTRYRLLGQAEATAVSPGEPCGDKLHSQRPPDNNPGSVCGHILLVPGGSEDFEIRCRNKTQQTINYRSSSCRRGSEPAGFQAIPVPREEGGPVAPLPLVLLSAWPAPLPAGRRAGGLWVRLRAQEPSVPAGPGPAAQEAGLSGGDPVALEVQPTRRSGVPGQAEECVRIKKNVSPRISL